MKRLEPQETVVVGHWIAEAAGVRADETCDRIQWLVSHVLEKTGVSKASAGWEALYRDPDDGRYWEHTYPKGEMHGGGPPALKNIPEIEAKAKYDF